MRKVIVNGDALTVEDVVDVARGVTAPERPHLRALVEDRRTGARRAERRFGARLFTGLRQVLAPRYGSARERLSVCLFIGALGVNFRICRRWHDCRTRLLSD